MNEFSNTIRNAEARCKKLNLSQAGSVLGDGIDEIQQESKQAALTPQAKFVVNAVQLRW